MPDGDGGAALGSRTIGRDLALDALRGFAILSVLLGHVLVRAQIPSVSRATVVALFVLYMYNAQVFAFVSGFLLKRPNVRRIALRLLLPLLTAVFLSAVIGAVRNGDDIVSSLTLQIYTAMNGSGIWFLWALFLCTSLLVVLRRTPWALVVVALVLGTTWRLFPLWETGRPQTAIDLLGAFRTVGLLLPSMALGALWRRYEERGLRLTLPMTAMALTGFMLISASLMWLQRAATPSLPTSLGWNLLQVVGTSLACVGMLGIARRLGGHALTGLAFFGPLAIGIYLSHALLIKGFVTLFTAHSLVELAAKTLLLLAASVALTLLAASHRYTSVLFLGGRCQPSCCSPTHHERCAST